MLNTKCKTIRSTQARLGSVRVLPAHVLDKNLAGIMNMSSEVSAHDVEQSTLWRLIHLFHREMSLIVFSHSEQHPRRAHQ